MLVHVCRPSGEKQKQGWAGPGEVIWGNATERPLPAQPHPACPQAHSLFSGPAPLAAPVTYVMWGNGLWERPTCHVLGTLPTPFSGQRDGAGLILWAMIVVIVANVYRAFPKYQAKQALDTNCYGCCTEAPTSLQMFSEHPLHVVDTGLTCP